MTIKHEHSSPLYRIFHLKKCTRHIDFLVNPAPELFCDCSIWFFYFQVVAHLSCVSEPHVCLTDVVTDDQLEQLLRMCVMPKGSQSVHWGGPWATHALTSLLQDLLQGATGKLIIILL